MTSGLKGALGGDMSLAASGASTSLSICCSAGLSATSGLPSSVPRVLINHAIMTAVIRSVRVVMGRLIGWVRRGLYARAQARIRIGLRRILVRQESRPFPESQLARGGGALAARAWWRPHSGARVSSSAIESSVSECRKATRSALSCWLKFSG